MARKAEVGVTIGALMILTGFALLLLGVLGKHYVHIIQGLQAIYATLIDFPMGTGTVLLVTGVIIVYSILVFTFEE